MDEFTEQGNLHAPGSRGRPFSKGNPGRMLGSKIGPQLLRRQNRRQDLFWSRMVALS
jgi:hypothetical protein